MPPCGQSPGGFLEVAMAEAQTRHVGWHAYLGIGADSKAGAAAEAQTRLRHRPHTEMQYNLARNHSDSHEDHTGWHRVLARHGRDSELQQQLKLIRAMDAGQGLAATRSRHAHVLCGGGARRWRRPLAASS